MVRKKTLVDELLSLPWWLNLILAAIAYVTLKYGLPNTNFSTSTFKALSNAFSSMAGIIAMLFVLFACVSAFNSWRKGELLKRHTDVTSSKNLTWREFEYLVSETYRRQGYQVSENPSAGPDGGIDLILKKNNDTVFVQCKHWQSKNVGVGVIRELLGVITAEKATGGIVVCSGEFTAEARVFAKANNIELINGAKLYNLIKPLQTNATYTPNIKTPNTDIYCPVCKSPMVLRQAKRGPNAGGNFLGCKRFPQCRGTRPIE